MHARGKPPALPALPGHERACPTPMAYPPNSPLLAWSTVEARLVRARHYWLATASIDGAPIMRPVDGMWVDAALYFDGDPATRWRRNLAVNERASVTLQEADSAVILEGAVSRVTPDAHLASALAAQANAKYEAAAQSVADYDVEICRFKPHSALAWTLLFQDATRFRFS